MIEISRVFYLVVKNGGWRDRRAKGGAGREKASYYHVGKLACWKMKVMTSIRCLFSSRSYSYMSLSRHHVISVSIFDRCYAFSFDQADMPW